MNNYMGWQLFDDMPSGWKIDKTCGSPLHGYEFAINGSPLKGGKRILVRVQSSQKRMGVQMISKLGVSDRFVRLTHSQVYTIKKYISDRDGIGLLEVELSEQDRALFVEGCDTTPPPGSQFQSFEVEELRNKLYPPRKKVKKVIPKLKPIPAPIEPKRNIKLTTLQQKKFDEMGLDIEKVGIRETFEGGKRPQHQVLIIKHNNQTIKMSRRGKIISTEENDDLS